MMTNVLYFRKHWKPPYVPLQAIILLALLLAVRSSHGLEFQEENVEETEDLVEIIWESTIDTITFTLNDTENFAIQNVTCRIIKNFVDSESADSACENLEPCTSYFATLIIRNISEESETNFEKIVEVATKYAEPSTEIVSLEPRAEEVLVQWKTTNKNCVSGFQIDLNSPEKSYKWSVLPDNNQQLMEGLSPCQEYDMQLKTYSNRTELISNLTTSTSTLFQEPGRVNVTLVPHQDIHMRVTWTQPSAKNCVNYFFLKWYLPDCTDIPPQATTPDTSFPTTETTQPELEFMGEEDDSLSTGEDRYFETTFGQCLWTVKINNSNAVEYIIQNLQGCQPYTFEIHINGEDNLADDPMNFTSPEQVPGPVSLQESIIDATTATLRWNPPVQNPMCVKVYRVVRTGPLQDPGISEIIDAVRVTTFVQWNDLAPCGMYNVSIIPESPSIGIVGLAVSSIFETMEAEPSAVQNYAVEPEPNALNISWSPPAFAHLCLNGYRISGWRDETASDPNFDKFINDTQVRIEGLFSCQSYTIQIIPTTKNSQDGELKQIDTVTSAKVAQIPTNFQAIGHYPHSLELSAKDSDLNNKCETIFARFKCNATAPAGVIHPLAVQYVEGLVGGISFKAYLFPLSPFTEYKCDVSLFNVAGWSAEKEIIERTEPYFPDPPEHVTLKASTNTTLNFGWRIPTYPYGNIKLYILHFQRVEAGYFIPSQCTPVNVDNGNKLQTASLEQLYTNLLPYSIYSLQVAAQNEYGVGEYTRPFMVITDPDTPEPVTNLFVLTKGPDELEAEYKASVFVSWVAPCRSNGEIQSYELNFYGERPDHPSQHFQHSIAPNLSGDGAMHYEETNLRPEFSYSVSVKVRVRSKTGNMPLLSVDASKNFEAPAGIPQRFDDVTVGKTEVDPYEAQNPTKSAFVRIPADILQSESGTIIYVALLISQKGCNPSPPLRFGAVDPSTDWPLTASWHEVYDNESDCIYQYQTTPKHWIPTPWWPSDSGPGRANTDGEFNFTIGIEKCDGQQLFCNGPLRPDTEYYLVIRLFTKSGFNDAAVLTFKTDSLIKVTLIVISITACLLLAFIGGLTYLWITKRKKLERASCHGIEDTFGNVHPKNFAVYYRDLSKPDKLAREFKELTMVAMDLSYAASELGANKNRYADIFPYDKNRVILDIDADGSDYINASFIDGYRRKKEYIATQGPKPESTMDFWRMVLQHNVRVIVMVTQFREEDTIKCHEYFPFTSKAVNAVVKRKETFDIYDRREIIVTHEQYGLKQKVVHFYFKKWPDHGVPADPMHLISFVRKVKAEKVPSYSPIVVHCSAGVGRTGTFIGLDIIMQRLKNESKINIYETVKKLRFQRMKMVQTLAQYTFLYTCTYELVKHKNARAMRKKSREQQKTVTFETDPEVPDHNLHTTGMEHPDSMIMDSDKESMRNSFNLKNGDLANFISMPIKFGGLRKGSDLESLDEQPDVESNCSNGSSEHTT